MMIFSLSGTPPKQGMARYSDADTGFFFLHSNSVIPVVYLRNGY